jgi:hypothetical protein
MLKKALGAIAALIPFSSLALDEPWHCMGHTDEGEKLVLDG